MPQPADDERPRYEQVAAALEAEIARGELRPGDRLPSVRGLARKFAVAEGTAGHALRSLRDRGVVTRDSTRGYFVRAASKEAPPAAAQAEGSPEFREIMREVQGLRADLARLSDRLGELEEQVGRASRE